MNPLNVMWTEKYRPKKIDDMVGDFKDKIKNYLKNHDAMQHLLFYSLSPGTGKSSMVKVIINELGADALILNSSDDRKIETVREKINMFVQTKSTKPNMRRIVFLDEVDGLTNIAQDALRNVMETYATNAIFLMTCNRLSSVSEPIQSRCVLIKFNSPDKKEMYEYLKKICDNEGMKYSEKGLLKIIDLNYPNIRNCVQTLQSLFIENKNVTEEEAKTANETYQILWDKLTKEKDWKIVKEYIFGNDVNVRDINSFFWYKAVEESNMRMIQITASNEDKFVRGGENIIIFVTSLIDMVK